MSTLHITFISCRDSELPDFLDTLPELGCNVEVRAFPNLVLPQKLPSDPVFILDGEPNGDPAKSTVAKIHAHAKNPLVLLCLESEELLILSQNHTTQFNDFILRTARAGEVVSRVRHAQRMQNVHLAAFARQTKDAEKQAYALANANVQLLEMKESLESRNAEMQQMMEEVSRNRNLLQSILETSASAMLLETDDKKIAVANQRVESFFRIKSQKAIGSSFSSLCKKIAKHFVDEQKFWNIQRELEMQADKPEFEHEILHQVHKRGLQLKSDPSCHLALFSTEVTGIKGESIGRLWAFADITNLYQADALLHAIVEMSPMPFIVTRFSDGYVLFANEPLARLLGYDKDQVIGVQTTRIYENPNDRDFILKELSEKGQLIGHEVRIRKADGTPVWMILSLTSTMLNDERIIVGALYDINERREMEERLRESEERFRQLMENIDFAFFMRDYPSRKLVYVSPSVEKIYGVSPEVAIKKQDLLIDAVHPDDLEMLKEKISNPDVNKKMEIEFRILHPTDGQRWIRVMIFPIRDQNGEIYRVCGVTEDITTRKRAEAKLAIRLRYEKGLAGCSQALLAAGKPEIVLNNALECLLNATNASRVYLFENFIDDANALCMRHRFEVCAKDAQSFLGDPQLQHAHYSHGFQRWEQVLSAGEVLRGFVRDFPESERSVLLEKGIQSILILPLFVGQKWYGFVGFDDENKAREWGDEDIRLLKTGAEMVVSYIERHQVLEAMFASEERFRTLVENANDIIFSLSEDGRFAYISPQWETILGYDLGQTHGQSCYDFIHPDDIEKCRAFFTNAMKNEGQGGGIEFRFQSAKGEWRWQTTNVATVYNENKSFLSLICIAHDTTEKKAVVDELERINTDLRLTQSQLVQSEKMAALGNLVAGIAHEINTPVGAIHSMHDTLSRAVFKLKEIFQTFCDTNEPHYQKIVGTMQVIENANHVIDTGSSRVTNIVKRLKSFARLDEAELKEIDLHEGIEDTLTLVHHETKHRIEIKRNFGTLPLIACFPGRLNQVFLNLLINANQAIKEKGQVTITTFLKDKKVHIIFEDTGIGIDPMHLAKIFDPGFTTKGVGIGTGLGLSICYRIMQEHQGVIEVESEVGKGSRFSIIFPGNLDEIYGDHAKEMLKFKTD